MVGHGWIRMQSDPAAPAQTGTVIPSNDEEVPAVHCRVNISAISDIDPVAHSFIAKFEVQLRMAASLHAALEAAGEVRYDRLYAFANLAEFIDEPDERLDHVGDEVILKVVTRAKFSQYFTLRQFPHDEHLLYIRLTSNIPCLIPPTPGSKPSSGTAALQLRLVEDTAKPNVMRAHHFFMARDTWVLSPAILTERWLSDPSMSGSGKQYPHFYWYFLLSRRPAFFHWNVSAPIFVLTSLSFAAFALEEVSDRVAVNLTLLLTSVAYKLVVVSSLPQLSYLTVLDKYTLFSSLVICTVFAVDTVLQPYEKIVLPLVIGGWCVGSLIYAAFCVTDTGKFSDLT